MESIAGRVAFTSGGSCRIGAAVARSLADNVARVALGSRMRPEDVAEAVLFDVTRPRSHRILGVALRPVTEPSWG